MSGLNLVVDVDGTLADVSVRLSFLSKERPGPEDFANFNSEEMVLQDQPIKSAQQFFNECRDAVYPPYDQLIILTGRDAYHQQTTQDWLCKHFGWDPHAYMLIMRPESCRQMNNADFKDSVMRGLIQCPEFKNDRYVFFDDDLCICKKLSKYGLTLRAPYCWTFLTHTL